MAISEEGFFSDALYGDGPYKHERCLIGNFVCYGERQAQIS